MICKNGTASVAFNDPSIQARFEPYLDRHGDPEEALAAFVKVDEAFAEAREYAAPPPSTDMDRRERLLKDYLIPGFNPEQQKNIIESMAFQVATAAKELLGKEGDELRQAMQQLLPGLGAYKADEKLRFAYAYMRHQFVLRAHAIKDTDPDLAKEILRTVEPKNLIAFAPHVRTRLAQMGIKHGPIKVLLGTDTSDDGGLSQEEGADLDEIDADSGDNLRKTFDSEGRFHENYKSTSSYRVRSLLSQIQDIQKLPTPVPSKRTINAATLKTKPPMPLVAGAADMGTVISHAYKLAREGKPFILDIRQLGALSDNDVSHLVETLAPLPNVTIATTRDLAPRGLIYHQKRNNHLGLPQYVDIDNVYEKILHVFKDRNPDVKEAFRLLEEAGTRDVLIEAVRRRLLAESPQTQKEFVGAMSKHFTEMTLLLWSRGRDGGDLRVINSDQQNAAANVLDSWGEDQRRVEMVKHDADGEPVFDLEMFRGFVSEYKEAYDKAAQVDGGLSSDSFILHTQRFLDRLGIFTKFHQLKALAEDSNLARAWLGAPWSTAMHYTDHATPGYRGSGNVFITWIVDAFVMDTEEGQKTVAFLKNNPLQDDGASSQRSSTQGALKKFAKYIAETDDILLPTSYRNVEGKAVYGFQLSTRMSRRVAGASNNPEKFVAPRIGTAFGSGSRLGKELLAESQQFRDKLKMKYVDGLREKTDNEGGKKLGNATLGERLLYAIGLFQVSASTGVPVFVDSVKSDKQVIPQVQMPLPDFYREHMVEEGQVKEISKNAIGYIADLVTGEARRIVYVQSEIRKGRQENHPKEFLEGGQKFVNYNAFLNIDNLREAITERGWPSSILTAIWNESGMIKNPNDPAFQAALHEAINLYVRERMAEYKAVLLEENLLKDNGESLMSEKYLNKMGSPSINDRVEKALLEFTLGYMIFYREAQILWSGDPAYAWKKNGPTTEINIEKRAAMDIAPTTHYPFPEGDTIKIATLVDVEGHAKNYAEYAERLGEKEAAKYAENNPMDAQEYVTVREKIWVLLHKGEITQDQHDAILDKIVAADMDGSYYYELSEAESKLLLGKVDKPLYSGDVLSADGKTMIPFYRKSSALPLLPSLTNGTDLDRLRVEMERTKTGRVAFGSADKMGAVNPLLVDDMSTFSLEGATMILPREDFGHQQDLPEKEYEIRMISQMNKLLFSGIRDYTGFDFKGKSISAKSLEDHKRKVMTRLYELGRQRVADRFEIEDGDGDPVKLSWKALSSELMREAEGRGWTVAEIQGLRLNDTEDGMIIPPAFSPAFNRIESLLLSVISNEVVKQKMPGKGFVQVSSWGIDKNVTFPTTTSYDPNKGLQGPRFVYEIDEKEYTYEQSVAAKHTAKQRKEAKKRVLPAQIFVPFHFKDSNGNKLDVKNFMRGGKIDPALLPPDLLRVVAGRIPNQGHSSMLPVEIVGFIPSDYGAAAIVPDMITTQMGSDFDIDKLYTYFNNYHYNDGTKSFVKGEEGIALLQEEIAKIDAKLAEGTLTPEDVAKRKGRLKKASKALRKLNSEDAKLRQEIFEIHWSVLNHPDVLERVIKPLDLPELMQAAEWLEIQKPSSSIPMDSVLRQAYDSMKQKMGTDLIGEWALYSQLLSIVEKTPLYLQKRVKVDGKPTLAEWSIPVRIGGKTIHLNTLGGAQNPNSTRSKEDVVQMFLSAAVDNAKENVLGRVGATWFTTGPQAALVMLQSEEGEHIDAEFVSLFTRAEAIEKLQATYDRLTSPIGGSTASAKEAAMKEVRKYYREQYNRIKGNPVDKEVRLSSKAVVSAEALRASIQTVDGEGKPLAAPLISPEQNALLMLKVLDLFEDLDTVAQSMKAVRKGVLFAYRKGAGTSTLEAIEHSKASSPTELPGKAENLRGVDRLLELGDDVPTEEHAATIHALNYMRKVLAMIFPFDTDGFTALRKELGKALGRTPRTDELARMWRGVTQYVHSTPGTALIKDPAEARRRLTQGTFEVKGVLKDIPKTSHARLESGAQRILIGAGPVVNSNGIYKIGDNTYFVSESEMVNVEAIGGETLAREALGVSMDEKVHPQVQAFFNGEVDLYLSSVEKRGDKSDRSLGDRVIELQQTNLGRNNYFLRRLRVRSPRVEGDPTTITFPSNKEGNLGEGHAVLGLVNLLMSEDPDVRRVGEDLVLYAQVMGGVSSPKGFSKFIPHEILEEMGHGDVLRSISFEEDMGNTTLDVPRFFRQFVRHHPQSVSYISSRSIEAGISKGVWVPPPITELAADGRMAKSLLRKNFEGEPEYARYIHTRYDDSLYLFELTTRDDGSQVYVRVPLLGIDGNHTEYDPDSENPVSLSSKNKIKEVEFKKQEASKRYDNMTESEYRAITFGDSEDAVEQLNNLLKYIKEDAFKAVMPLARGILQEHRVSGDQEIQLVIHNEGAQGARNQYSLDTHTIDLIETRDYKYLQQTALHEIFHMGTVAEWKRVQQAVTAGTATDSEKKTHDELVKVHAYMKRMVMEQTGRDGYEYRLRGIKQNGTGNIPENHWIYAVSSVEEMLVAALTDSHFQAFANKFESPLEKKSMFAKLVDLLSKLFERLSNALGIDVRQDSALGVTLIHAAKLMGVNPYLQQDKFQYFGKEYHIELDEGIPARVYHTDLERTPVKTNYDKILAFYSENPDVDPQTGEKFRNQETEEEEALPTVAKKPTEVSPHLKRAIGGFDYTSADGTRLNKDQIEAAKEIQAFLRSKDPKQNAFLLSGRGGVGKTTMMRVLLESPELQGRIANVMAVAPTHAGVEVLEDSLGIGPRYRTLDSALSRVVNKENGETKMVWSGRSRDISSSKVDVVIVDEASMVDDDTYNEVMEALRSGAKVIFMGDSAQSLPTRQDHVSTLFNEIKLGYTLTQSVRQADGTPIYEFVKLLGDLVDAGDPRNLKADERIDGTSPLGSVAFTNDEQVAFNRVGVALRENIGKIGAVKLIAYRNELSPGVKFSVNELNHMARTLLWGEDEAQMTPFHRGEILTSRTNIKKDGKVILANRKDVQVLEVEEERYLSLAEIAPAAAENLDYEAIKVYDLLVEDDKGVRHRITVPSPDEAYIINNLLKEKTLGKALKPLMNEVQVFNYGYAITVNSSQGKTFENVFVFEDNINAGSRQVSHRNRHRYVAASRASKSLHMINTTAPTGNDIHRIEEQFGFTKGDSETDYIQPLSTEPSVLDDLFGDDGGTEVDQDSETGYSMAPQPLGGSVSDFMKTLTVEEREAFRRLREEGRISTHCKL